MRYSYLFLVLCVSSIASVRGMSDTFVANCAPLTIQRSDPIISPGVASGHVHSVVGGNAFSRNMTGINAATNANATTCDKKLDHSNYWVPQLYHARTDGRFEMVPWTGTAIYYQRRACNYTTAVQYCDSDFVPLAFPVGFRMIAGDTTLRTYNDSDFAQRAIQMMCMNDATGNSIQFQGFPTVHCDKIRAEVYFPSCWDGVNIDSANHKSHVAYPSVGNYDGGICPASHPVAIFSIFYEFFFDTSSYNDTNRFVFANGDTTGYGFHGDFIMGWTNRTTLQTAFQTCVGPTDAQCPINTAGAAPGQDQQGPQTLIYPAIYEEDIGLAGNPIAKLPGNNPANFTNSGPPRFKIIATKSGAYIVAANSTSPLLAIGTSATASIFDLMPQTGGFVAIRNEIDGNYVTVTSGTAPLIANRNNPQGWEFFTLQSSNISNVYSLGANADSQLVAVQSDHTLVANGGAFTTVSTATQFTIVWL